MSVLEEIRQVSRQNYRLPARPCKKVGMEAQLDKGLLLATTVEVEIKEAAFCNRRYCSEETGNFLLLLGPAGRQPAISLDYRCSRLFRQSLNSREVIIEYGRDNS